MAGEFPVAQIYTASVFQMFVSVVFIREHFATALTLVSFRIWKYTTLVLFIGDEYSPCSVKIPYLSTINTRTCKIFLLKYSLL